MTSSVRSEDKQVNDLVRELESNDVEARRSAATSLCRLAALPGTAPIVARNSVSLTRLLRDKDGEVRRCVLRAMRSLVESGECQAVACQTRDIVTCLKDEDPVIRSKTAALCRVIAEEGGAVFLAPHVPKLMECFECSSLVTPLDALRALADAGEAVAVAHGIGKLVNALNDKSSRVRSAACEALAAIGRGGGGDLLRRLRIIEQADERAGNNTCKPLLDVLTSLVQNDPDKDTQLASALALQSIADADPESAEILRERYSHLLVQVMCWPMSRTDKALRQVIRSILPELDDFLDDDHACNPEASDSDSNEDEPSKQTCVICQRGLQRHGTRRTLPCHHIFHTDCIKRWLSWSKRCWNTQTCPICRNQDPLFKPRVAASGSGTAAPRTRSPR